MSTVVPSRSDIRSGPQARGSRSISCTSCAGEVAAWERRDCAEAAARAAPWCCACPRQTGVPPRPPPPGGEGGEKEGGGGGGRGGGGGGGAGGGGGGGFRGGGGGEGER